MLKNRELQAYAELCTEGRRVPDDEVVIRLRTPKR